jgi:glucose-1-phosphate thymidylyltransferase
MITIILAGGYAKRLQPLTKNKPKPLLPVAGKPILKYILEKVEELPVNHIILSTNMRFKSEFEEWLAVNGYGDVDVVADDSRCEEEKPGAVKALAELTANLHDDRLIVAGDNLFTDGLKGMVEMFNRLRAPVIALYDVKSLEAAKNYSTVTVNQDGRIVGFTEKPSNPKTTLIGTCIYIFPSRILPKIKEYVDKGLGADEPGRFIEWLHKQEPVYGYRLKGEWWDIGTPETYTQANKSFTKLKEK